MAMTGDRAHGGEHAQIFYPAAFELLEHHPLVRVFEVNCHCQRYYTETPGNDYLFISRAPNRTSSRRAMRRLQAWRRTNITSHTSRIVPIRPLGT
jgi:hypothetical protein